jgi:hypothetical protein
MSQLLVAGPAVPRPPAAVKVLGLFRHLQTAQQTHEHVSFDLSEAEINEYMFMPLLSIHGRAAFRFQATAGRTTFSVEKAYFQKIRLPAFFISQLIHAVAARQREHYDTSKPVPLPFGLQKVWTQGPHLYGEN